MSSLYPEMSSAHKAPNTWAAPIDICPITQWQTAEDEWEMPLRFERPCPNAPINDVSQLLESAGLDDDLVMHQHNVYKSVDEFIECEAVYTRASSRRDCARQWDVDQLPTPPTFVVACVFKSTTGAIAARMCGAVVSRDGESCWFVCVSQETQ